MANIPHRIATLQLVTPIEHRSRFRHAYTRLTVRHALAAMHHIIAVSHADKLFLMRHYFVPAASLTVIPNAVRQRPAHISPTLAFHTHPVIAVFGRLHIQKGHRILLKAIEMVINVVPQLKLLVVGSGPEKDKLERFVNTHQLSDQVLFLGFRKDIESLLTTVDIVAVPSLAEGFPFIMLEAMAAGKPVVASDLPGIRECIQDGVSGLLVEPGNPEQLADALLYLLTHPTDAVAMGRRAKRIVTNKYDLDDMLIKLNRLYQPDQ